MSSVFSVELFKPNGDHVPAFERLQFTPVWYSATAIGGYETADIRVDGPADALHSLLRLLGYTVHIRNANHTIVWSGVIDEVTITAGAQQIGSSIKNIVNRVKVAYTSQTPDGTLERLTTDWASDSESINRYGYAERLYTKSDVSQAQAEAYRDTLIATLKDPTPILRLQRGSTQAPSGMMSCSGQWSLLSRQLFANVSGLVEHNTSGGSDQLLGVGKTTTEFGFSGNKIVDFSNDVDALPTDVSVVISGSTSNDGTVTTTRGGTDGQTYIASTIAFDPSDDILDSASGLAFLSDNDVINVSGSSSNDEVRVVTDAINAEHITVGGTTITTEAEGPTITIVQAGYVETDTTFTTELPSASTTLTVVGVYTAQKFTLADNVSWTVNDISIRIRKVGSPTDNVIVSLYTDSSGSPGTSIEQATKDGTEIGTATAWHKFIFTNANTISYGTNYWIVVARSGANSMDNYYIVDVDETLGYTSGDLKVWNSSSWVARSPDADMPFIVRGAEETTLQISNIATNAGQFIDAVDIQDASSVESNQYRSGDGSALFEIEQLIESGTNTGARLFAKVTPEKTLSIYQQETSDPSRDLILLSDGTVTQPTGRFEPGVLPVGKWVRVVGIQSGVDHLAPLSRFPVERAEYQVESGDLLLEPPGETSLWTMGISLQ